jgi:hypothetical protein
MCAAAAAAAAAAATELLARTPGRAPTTLAHPLPPPLPRPLQVDDSEGSDRAFEFAVKHLHRPGVELHLCNVVPRLHLAAS